MPLAPGQSFEDYLAEDVSSFPFRAGIICIVLVTIAYSLRLVSRRLQRAPWGWDDSLMVIAYLSTIATAASVIYAAMYGSGRHVEWFHLNMMAVLDAWGANCIYVSAFCYMIAVTAPKLVILVLYLRIFIDRFSRWCCWITTGILVANMVVNYFTIGFQCDEFSNGWKPWMWPDHCTNVLTHYTWASFPNIVTDVVMLVLPLPALWRLKLPIQVKAGLVMTLMVGSVGLVTAIIRFVEFNQHAMIDDITWNAAQLEAWTTIETSMYSISACLLTYRPLLRRVLGRRMDPVLTYAYSQNRTRESRRLTAQLSPIKDPAWRIPSPVTSPAPSPTAATYGGSSSDGLYRWEVESPPMREIAKPPRPPRPARLKMAHLPVGFTRYDADPHPHLYSRASSCTCADSVIDWRLSTANVNASANQYQSKLPFQYQHPYQPQYLDQDQQMYQHMYAHQNQQHPSERRRTSALV